MTAPTLTQAPEAVHDALTVRTLKESLLAVLSPDQRNRFVRDTAAVAEQGATALDTRFPAAGRYYGRGPLPGWADWSVEDGIRTVLLLLLRLPAQGGDPAAEAAARYGGGDAAERRGVLRALPFLRIGAAGLTITDDALRTNDTRLISAALGPYARVHLDQYRWRQAVLKCLFTGIPLHRVAGLHERRDAELARMAQGFAAERRAAGRTVPADLWLVATQEAA
ncbi:MULTISPECIES: EboA domain-containing protein [Streptomyces]|uniref:EboA domain-containing protein n=1 Tax=Streptomyces TaxID=1883 RepID=UPI000A3B0C3A|nr:MULTISPECIES: EboA domain-containing protein [Streptomyces]MDX3611489.1 EboA domain-containing protein [Streptomyces europaeiscabiei]MDX3629204.1 EboA domain-containing protein [Streptomyces europaeiscabiei]MDX3647178.1 EboA domain-containing protein [Streptomyces europaeiscabiei]